MKKNSNSEITGRLVKEREEKKMTQEDMARLLGINQGQYSSVEGGLIRISRDYLVKLHAEGWDVDYILIEKSVKIQEKGLRNRLIEYESYQQKKVLQHVYLAFLAVAEDDQNKKEYEDELELLHGLLERKAGETVLYVARKMMGKAQMDMAEIVGVSIKKYRKFEKGYSFPDGELLRIIGKETNCRATLFMGLDSEEWSIAEYIWSNIDERTQEEILDLINQEIRFLNVTSGTKGSKIQNCRTLNNCVE